MRSIPSFCDDARTFESWKSKVREVFIIDSGLPEQVFQNEYRSFAFDDMSWAMGGDFWPAIQRLAAQTGDETILMGVLEPDPETYFKREFGHYNWVDIPVAVSGEQYWDLLNRHSSDNIAEVLLFNSEKIVWLPGSAKWAIWGERRYETCVLGCRQPIEPDEWKNLDWLMESDLQYCFRPFGIPEEFRRRLMRNYASRAHLDDAT